MMLTHSDRTTAITVVLRLNIRFGTQLCGDTSLPHPLAPSCCWFRICNVVLCRLDSQNHALTSSTFLRGPLLAQTMCGHCELDWHPGAVIFHAK